jgi:hypothetical protein
LLRLMNFRVLTRFFNALAMRVTFILAILMIN